MDGYFAIVPLSHSLSRPSLQVEDVCSKLTLKDYLYLQDAL